MEPPRSLPAHFPHSLPRYAPLATQDSAQHHLLVVATAEPDAMSILPALAGDLTGRHTLLLQGGEDDGAARTLDHALAAALDQAPAGTHLYLTGPEPRIWALWNVARSAGLAPDAIQLAPTRRHLRQVYCVHCARQHLAPAAEALTDCPHCGVALGVRQHFSRRLGAYLGVAARAEQGGQP
ncbi:MULTISPECIES: dimethylamine monooxygenase subunit DmmA family protein [Cupriavidus]|uniref:Dimethylamine monooxygenase subunit DmmA-like C-terminal domain-containing protein n=1 Tax=Cupriavidus metallidurans TaxID=119219 RepID=A0A482J6F7_9BURK|nr:MULTISPECIES: dimethylamine monooxygenase subunit DmmA family protein [Cupriavidus]MWL91946.1 hypothetical protein [Cupriavidus sp. SW-Y-13]QBP14544.1 hypothetical protein DDF84_033120 [Cupriavidus metallidurans]